METNAIPERPHSDIDNGTVHKVEAAILEYHRITSQQLATKRKMCRDREKNHSQLFSHAEVVYATDSPDIHTFLQAGTSQLLPGIFGNVTRKQRELFRQIFHKG